MDIKPIPATRPPAPLHKVDERKDTRREQGGKRRAEHALTQASQEADGGTHTHIDAYA